MYAGFKIELDTSELNTLENTLQTKQRHQSFKKFIDADRIESELKAFIMDGGSLDASKMLEHWFPEISCEVFISHSHKDKHAAESLAAWLHDKFGIKSFIDSLVWGFCDDLLRQIDNEYCRNSSKSSYNYYKRNISTAHVHMLLTTALTMMIDKSECLIFLNTPNSVNPAKSISTTNEQTTYSPWIYGELSFSRLLRRRPLHEHRISLDKYIALEEARQLAIQYPASQSHLIDINLQSLLEWSKDATRDPHKSLDRLYNIFKNNL